MDPRRLRALEDVVREAEHDYRPYDDQVLVILYVLEDNDGLVVIAVYDQLRSWERQFSRRFMLVKEDRPWTWSGRRDFPGLHRPTGTLLRVYSVERAKVAESLRRHPEWRWAQPVWISTSMWGGERLGLLRQNPNDRAENSVSEDGVSSETPWRNDKNRDSGTRSA